MVNMLNIDPYRQRAIAFLRYKTGHRTQALKAKYGEWPDVTLTGEEFIEWLLEYEEILKTSEREARHLLEEHMQTCNRHGT